MAALIHIPLWPGDGGSGLAEPPLDWGDAAVPSPHLCSLFPCPPQFSTGARAPQPGGSAGVSGRGQGGDASEGGRAPLSDGASHGNLTPSELVTWARPARQMGRWGPCRARWGWGLLCLPGAQWRLPPHPLTCPIVPLPGWGPAPPQGLPAPSAVAKARLKGSIHQDVRLANPCVPPGPLAAPLSPRVNCPLPPWEQARASGDRSQGLPSKSREHPRDCGAGRGHGGRDGPRGR